MELAFYAGLSQVSFRLQFESVPQSRGNIDFLVHVHANASMRVNNLEASEWVQARSEE